MEHAHCWGPHLHWFWLIPVFFMLLMLSSRCWMSRRWGSWRRGAWRHAGAPSFGCWDPRWGSSERWSVETPDQILDLRYARGEITKDQYEEMKRDLEARASSPESEDGS